MAILDLGREETEAVEGVFDLILAESHAHEGDIGVRQSLDARGEVPSFKGREGRKKRAGRKGEGRCDTDCENRSGGHEAVDRGQEWLARDSARRYSPHRAGKDRLHDHAANSATLPAWPRQGDRLVNGPSATDANTVVRHG
jgi:hypothetical protein